MVPLLVECYILLIINYYIVIKSIKVNQSFLDAVQEHLTKELVYRKKIQKKILDFEIKLIQSRSNSPSDRLEKLRWRKKLKSLKIMLCYTSL